MSVSGGSSGAGAPPVVQGRPLTGELRAWWHAASAGGANFFQSPAWVEPWADSFGARLEPFLVMSDGRPRSLLVLARVPGLDGGAALRPAGWPFADDLAIVGDGGAVPAGALLDHVAFVAWERRRTGRSAGSAPAPAEAPQVDNVPLGSTLLVAARARGWRVEDCGHGSEVELPDTWPAFLDATHRRDAARRRVRQRDALVRAGYTPFTATGTDAVAAVGSLIDLFAHSWRRRRREEEIGGAQRSPSFRTFIVDAVARAAATAFAPAVIGFRRGRRLAAAELVVVLGPRRWLVNLTAHDPDLAAHGPGILARLEVVRAAIEAGIAVLDMGRGDEHYKTRLGATFSPLSVISPGAGAACGPRRASR